jgi:WD40 repeat protein
VRELLTAFPRLGPAGADIFCREAQLVWPELRPALDRKVLDGARRLCLPTNGGTEVVSTASHLDDPQPADALAVVDLRPSTPSGPTKPAAPPVPAGLVASITGLPFGTRHVALTELNSGPVAVVGRPDGIDVWDLRSGKRTGQSLNTVSGGVSALTVTPLNGRTAVVTSGSSWYDGTSMSVWDLNTRESLAQPFADDVPGHGPTTGVAALTQLDGGPVAVVSIGDDRLRAWDLAAGKQLGQPFGSLYGLSAVALTWLDGRRVALTNNKYDQIVRMWDLTTGEQLDQPLAGHTDFIYAVATGVLDGRPIAVTASRDATVRIWDLATRRQLGRPVLFTGSTSTASIVATGELDARPVAVTAADSPLGDGTINIWDLRTVAGT